MNNLIKQRQRVRVKVLRRLHDILKYYSVPDNNKTLNNQQNILNNQINNYL